MLLNSVSTIRAKNAIWNSSGIQNNTIQQTDRKYRLAPYSTQYADVRSGYGQNEDTMSTIKQWCFECSLLPPKYFEINVWPTSVLYVERLFANVISPERFENLLKWMGYFFIWDDHNETKHGQFYRDTKRAYVVNEQSQEAIDRLELLFIKGTNNMLEFGTQLIKMDKWKPYILGIYSVTEIIMTKLKVEQRRRLLLHWRQWLKGQHLENKLVNDPKILEYDDFINTILVPSKCVGLTIELLEYSSGIFVPESEWTDPNILRLRQLTEQIIAYVNDVYSFEKELNDEGNQLNKMVFNVVGYFALKDHLTIPNAIQKCIQTAHQMEAEFQKLSVKVEASDGYSPDTKHFVNDLNVMLSATLYGALILYRYNWIYKDNNNHNSD